MLGANKSVGLAACEPLDEFLPWVLQLAGLNAEHYRPQPLQRRLGACLRALRVKSVDQAKRLLCDRPEALPAAVDALLIGVTGFYRDREVFDAIARDVLPQLAADACGRVDWPIRVWSAACSSGAELATVAVLLAEAGLLAKSELLGTDCRQCAIRSAESGLFRPEQIEGLEPRLRDKYFVATESGLRLALPNDGVITWKQADLLAGAEDGPWDMVLCRNAVMYMTSQAADSVWRRLAGVVRPGGFLVVGKAERPGVASLFRRSPCVYRREC